MGLLDSQPDKYLPRDRVSGNLLIIEPEHGAIHAGDHYTLSVLTTTSSYLTLVYTSPAEATKQRAHFVFSANTDKAAILTFSEAAVVSAGTSIVPPNNNRASSKLGFGSWVIDPVVTTTGTVIERHAMGTAGSGSARPGGDAAARNEWYLDYGKTYMLRIACDQSTTRSEITVPYYYREVT